MYWTIEMLLNYASAGREMSHEQHFQTNSQASPIDSR